MHSPSSEQQYFLDASRSDFIIQFARRALPRHSILVALLYSSITFGGTIALTAIWNYFRPPDDDTIGLFRDYGTFILWCFVLPIAIVLVFNFYNRVNTGFQQLVNDRVAIFESHSKQHQFLSEIDQALNRPWFFYLSILLALACDTSMMWGRESYWNSGIGGPNVWWFRLFSIINISVIFHIAMKSFVVVRSIRKLFTHEVVLQPLHPDGCGGLRSLGDISLAINYMVGIVAVYLSVLVFSGYPVRDSPVFLAILVAYAAGAGYLFFSPLSGAHDLMETEKRDILYGLNREFQTTYARLSSNLNEEGIALRDAQKIESLERLHRIASRMPVWPMDTRILGQFMAVVAIPLIMGLITESIKLTWFPLN